MLPSIAVGQRSLNDYATLAPSGLIAEVRRLAEPLAGKRVLHVSATAFGGGVAEINHALLPLMRDAGLEADWRIILGDDEFFSATKTIHNGLQGSEVGLTAAQQDVFRRNQAVQAEAMEGEYDFVVIHDPQPIGMIDHVAGSSAKWIWRCHIDLSTPNPDVLDFVLPSLRRYDASIYHMDQYVPRADGLGPAYVWGPAIDPLAPKNMALSTEDATYIVNQLGVDVQRPLLTQVSRFDPWKDPLGVIDAYRLVKEEVPDVQLALIGSMAHDDPEGWEFYEKTTAHAAGDPDIFVLSNLDGVGFVEVNAFQILSAVVIQKSLREGFGLTVSEALWKSRPTVAGRVGGIVAQIEDGVSGWLVDSTRDCAHACIEILSDPDAARVRALRGKESVRTSFLMPRLLRDWLLLFNRLLESDHATAASVPLRAHSG